MRHHPLLLVGRVRVEVAPHAGIFGVKESELSILNPSDPHPGPPHKGEGEGKESWSIEFINKPVPLA
jgi:hypothetical protein